jgi:DNA (cytosine-5)-methyltransferase 1
VSTLSVVADVLREAAPRALRAKEIADLARDRLPTASRTPETVISRDLAIDVRDKGAASRFLRVDRGEFVLKEALPTAFYNDVDPYVTAWTRNLIAAGQIAAGVVDERSIRDLRAADVASYRQCHFFSGIGTWSRALRDAGWPDDVPVWSGSCPCGPWSQAGQKRGFDDEQHLWPEWFRLIRACRPPVVVGEQVASKDGLAWLDVVLADLEGAAYAVRAVDTCAAGYGAAHLRQRLYFVAVARERGREVVGAARLHDRGQSGDDAARRRAADGGAPVVLPDAADARRALAQDAGADRGDASARAEADVGRPAGDLEPQRGGPDDGACAVPDAERVVRHEGRIGGPHGRPEVEPDRHGEADGEAAAHGDGCGCLGYSVELGDAGLARGGRDAGALPRAEGVGEAEWIEARDLAHEPLAPGAADRVVGVVGVVDEAEVVRGAAGAAGDGSGFRPGDRIRIDGDPSWGGAVRGFWARDVEWIYCRPAPGHEDGCFRPAESGTQPLVDGPASGVGRTRAKRLRGYGNAIVLPQAKEFVGAVIETLADAAREIEIADAAKEVA